MSGVTVRIPEDHFHVLDEALAKPEEVVFLYATYVADLFEVDGIDVMVGADITSQSMLHVELADAVRPRVIKTAWDKERCLIEAHSHGKYGYAAFSPSDLFGFEDWVAHVRWRLRGRPYAALVKAGETWDALAWINGEEPVTVEALEITGSDGMVIKRLIPTNATAATLAAGGQQQ